VRRTRSEVYLVTAKDNKTPSLDQVCIVRLQPNDAFTVEGSQLERIRNENACSHGGTSGS
jgi:hypothetical protein